MGFHTADNEFSFFSVGQPCSSVLGPQVTQGGVSPQLIVSGKRQKVITVDVMCAKVHGEAGHGGSCL